jgi:hypothetical protein
MLKNVRREEAIERFGKRMARPNRIRIVQMIYKQNQFPKCV